jgi:8-oxo-dGTP diphosphatase
MTEEATPELIAAAGTIPWRQGSDGLEVALVHRPRYDDWSWPKGKLDPGEAWPAAASRETWEETGLRARLGRPLPPAEYVVLDRWGAPQPKVVRYWAATTTGAGRLINEIDEVAWLTPTAAHSRLDYSRDQDQLLAVVRADQSGMLDTWALAVVRHAKAVPRGDWRGKDDRARPLLAAGRNRASELVPLLSAYGVERFVSSSSTRCAETLEPAARAARRTLRMRDDLSEEGFEEDPAAALHRLDRVLRKSRPAAVCSHGPVIPPLLTSLAERIDDRTGTAEVADLLEAAHDNLGKGDVLVAHLRGAGDDATVVAAEWHRTQTD